MGRANLQQLLGNVDDRTAPGNESANLSDVVDPIAKKSPSRPVTAATKSVKYAVLPVQSATFSTMVRKETRIREDQQNALTNEARRLSRAKGVGGNRITENTLIRVAIDLLLSREHELDGPDEVALRRSLGI